MYKAAFEAVSKCAGQVGRGGEVAAEESTNAKCLGVLVPAIVTIARLKGSQGESSGAFEAVKECEARLRNFDKPHWNYLLNTFKARLSLDYTDMAAAESWLYQEITRTREFELIVLACLLIARGNLGDANLLLTRLLAFAQGEARRHGTVEILNLLAISAYQSDDIVKAMTYLGQSKTINILRDFLSKFGKCNAAELNFCCVKEITRISLALINRFLEI